MVNLVKIVTFAALAGASMAAPTNTTTTSTSSTSSTTSSISAKGTNSGGVTVTVQNNCGQTLQVNKLTNGAGAGTESQKVASGSSYDFQVPSDWSGRFWGCKSGDPNCQDYGSAVSLAEFLFKGYGGSDYYDISFVDGFNLPLSISPNGGSGGSCGSPICTSLPQCPQELQAENGACKSACAAFNSPEYCCTGAYNSPQTCKASQYAKDFKAACPDAYSYAYDDATSTFGCQSDHYTVTFCPGGSD